MRERSVPSSPILMSNLQRFGVCCSCFYVSCAAIRLITRPAPECILRISKPLLEVSFLLFFYFSTLSIIAKCLSKRGHQRGEQQQKNELFPSLFWWPCHFDRLRAIAAQESERVTNHSRLSFFFISLPQFQKTKQNTHKCYRPNIAGQSAFVFFSFVFANKHTRQLPKHQKNWENGRSILFAGRFVFNAILALPYIIYTQWLAYIGYTIQNAYIMYIELRL